MYDRNQTNQYCKAIINQLKININENTDKFVPMRIKNFCTLRGIIKKVKMQKVFVTCK